jgi:3-deoxy-D-manno-octulosonic-acid transferase
VFSPRPIDHNPAQVINGYDIAYGLGVGVSAPFWLLKPSARRKVLKALRERMGQDLPGGATHPAVLIHAVSLGEMNATRAMVRGLAESRPDLRFVISTTTDTGFTRGREIYGSDPRVSLIRYPLDFSSAVVRVLDRFDPRVVVLMELEVWPNFVLHCERRRIPVLLVNGRLTPSSFRNYRLGGPLVRRMFRRLSLVCAQEPRYAERFLALGGAPDRVRVTGTMKFDTAQIADRIEGSDQLARDLGLRPGQEPVLVCGSTGPGEEQFLLDIYRHLLGNHSSLRLVLVPRKPERFDEVADVIRGAGFGLVRRSKPDASDPASGNPVILGDTMGELRKFYSLADVVFVGRTLVDLGQRQHGSDMIEPAALAKPVIVGPFTGNFAEVMARFRAADAMREVKTAEELRAQIALLLSDRTTAISMGHRAREVVRNEQGATARHVELILANLAAATPQLLSSSRPSRLRGEPELIYREGAKDAKNSGAQG